MVVATITIGVISLGTLYKIIALSQGGEAVARMLGARPVPSATTDLQERRLLNVVEEIALASGTPVPRVFVLDNENSVNAFAAGFSTRDAVIGVTFGCLTQLTRDELQGVIAHEFSHILNGDMRLNLRLMGLLNGILIIGIIGHQYQSDGKRGAQERRQSDRVYPGGSGRHGHRLHRRILRQADQERRFAPARVPGGCRFRAVHAQPGRSGGRTQEDRRIPGGFAHPKP
jgi:hypothetical protein